MDLRNTFEVPLPLEQAWQVLLDIPRIAPCMPGAELVEAVDGDTYKGKVAVKLGPVALSFAGTAKFEEIDNAGRRARVKAQGQDARGRGGAHALVTFHLEPVATGSKVIVDTNLNLTGSVAQYGRGTGMIQSVANQLIGQFADNLKAELQSQPVVPASPAAPASHHPSAAPAAASPVAAPASVARSPAKPISGFSLLWQAMLDWLRGLFGGKR